MKNSQLELYAVTDRRWLKGRTLPEAVREALEGGATMIQLREKSMEREAMLSEAREIGAICRTFNVPFIIDDDVEAALACGADGVLRECNASFLSRFGLADADAARRRKFADFFMASPLPENFRKALAGERVSADVPDLGTVDLAPDVHGRKIVGVVGAVRKGS